jgi:hypothetical protein
MQIPDIIMIWEEYDPSCPSSRTVRKVMREPSAGPCDQSEHDFSGFLIEADKQPSRRSGDGMQGILVISGRPAYLDPIKSQLLGK